MNNQIPNHAEREYKKLKGLVRQAVWKCSTMDEMAKFLWDRGVTVSTPPVNCKLRTEEIKATTLGCKDVPEEEARQMLIASFMHEFEEKITQNVRMRRLENGEYEIKIPQIVPIVQICGGKE